jgi:hypothetical protein
MRSEVFIAVGVIYTVIWVAILCSVVGAYQHSGGKSDLLSSVEIRKSCRLKLGPFCIQD